MSLSSFISQPCTIVQRIADAVDTYGDQSKSEAQTASLCELQPVHAADAEGGNIGVTLWRLYLDGSVALNSDDAVIVDGETYELVGDAEPRRNSRTGMVDHTAALVRRVRDAV